MAKIPCDLIQVSTANQKIPSTIRLQPQAINKSSRKWSHLKNDNFSEKKNSIEEISRKNLCCVLYRLQDGLMIYINKSICVTFVTSADPRKNHGRRKASYMNIKNIATVFCGTFEGGG